MEDPSTLPLIVTFLGSVILVFTGAALLVNLFDKLTRRNKRP